jgi:general stress protein CsbA
MAQGRWWPTAGFEPAVALRGVILANSWQQRDAATILRYLALVVLFVLAGAVARRDLALGCYAIFVLAVPLLRGDPTHATLRFAAVLFPLWFELGRALERSSRWVRLSVMLLLLAATLLLSGCYAAGIEAY